MKKHNFNAGPSILADEVIEKAAKAVLDFNGSGLSVLSISHRTKDFDAVMEEADRLFRELLSIPDNYKIFYIGGGASTFFYEVAANFLGKKAGYVNTGVWSKKAIKEAKRYGEVEVLATSEDRNFTYIPKGFAIPEDLDYTGVFDDLFAAHTRRWRLEGVKTTGMGSLFELRYTVVLKDPKQEKAFLDELRCRNGNLTLSLTRNAPVHEEL